MFYEELSPGLTMTCPHCLCGKYDGRSDLTSFIYHDRRPHGSPRTAMHRKRSFANTLRGTVPCLVHGSLPGHSSRPQAIVRPDPTTMKPEGWLPGSAHQLKISDGRCLITGGGQPAAERSSRTQGPAFRIRLSQEYTHSQCWLMDSLRPSNILNAIAR